MSKNPYNNLNYFDDGDDDFSLMFASKKPNQPPNQNQNQQIKQQRNSQIIPPNNNISNNQPKNQSLSQSNNNNQTQNNNTTIRNTQSLNTSNNLNLSNNSDNDPKIFNSIPNLKVDNESPSQINRSPSIDQSDNQSNDFNNNIKKNDRKIIVQNDDEIIRKLLEEKSMLQIELESLKSSNSPASAINCLLKGLHVDLTVFKSIQQKEELLNLAIDSLDDDVLLQIVLFIRDTLKQDLFIEIIGKYKAASHHYICFLENNEEYKEIAFIYKVLKQPKEEGYAMISFANHQNAPSKKIQALTHAMNHFNTNIPNSLNIVQHLKNQIDLLKRQLTIDDFDESCQKRGDQIYVKFPRKNLGFSLVGSTLNQTLYYCLFYHPSASIDKLSSPLSLQKLFEIPENMCAWTKLNGK
eukprot:TRINITY_DN784_c3_g1_i1.p1 TRINITY_DN784_c3_g1~~TRINITY_DN784_c3_g1_i1.p1  ORF type:complete len:409 (-),score=105.16 TRINITY_DN784_c3_g1_i1:536-1762(-)